VNDMNGKSRTLLMACFVWINMQPAIGSPDLSWTAFYANGQQAQTELKLDLAEQNYRQALAAARKQTRDGADVDKCLRGLADVLSLRDKTGEAQQVYQELLSRLTKKYGANSSQVAPVLVSLGSLQEAAGDHASAMTFYQKSLAINEKNYGPYSPAVASDLHGLAHSMCAAGDKIEGEKHYKRAMAILSQDPTLGASKELQSLLNDYNKDLIKGDDNSNQQLINDFKKDILQQTPAPAPESKPPTGSSSWQQQQDSSAQIRDSYQTNEAEKVTLRGFATPMNGKSLDPAYRVMNDSVFKENHYGKGEAEYQRMIAIDINSLGPNHPSVANDLSGLGQLYIKQKRYAEAAPLLERALSIYDNVYGRDNMMSVNACTTLASAEFRIGNADKAANLYRRALTQSASVSAPNSIETAKILNELAYLYFHQGKLQDAATFYQWALASTEGAVGKDDSLTAACLKDYAQVLRSLGRADDANSFDSRAQGILATGSKPKL
jgi:tetratricopeptide (TPR) repeat protein